MGAMHEDLEVHVWKILYDAFHGIAAHFPCQIDAPGTSLPPEGDRGGVHGMGLRGEMELYRRADLAGKMDDARVGRYEAIYAEFWQCFELFFNGRKMFVAGHGVKAVVYAFPFPVDELNGLSQGRIVEASAFGTERERTAAKVDSVGPVEQGGFQLFASAGRGKEFWFAHREGHSSKIGWSMSNNYTPFAGMTSGAGQILR